jgi:modulator of FtsH protease HflK
MTMRWFHFLLIILFVGYLVTGIRQIQPGERAVVSRWGRVIDTPGPGLFIGFPYGIDRVQRVSVDAVRRIQIGFRPDLDDEDQEAPAGQLLTGDHNLVNVQVAVDFAVRGSLRGLTHPGSDLGQTEGSDQVADYVAYQERAEGIISRVGEGVLSEWIAGHTIDEILISAKARLPDFMVERLQERLQPYHLGVEIQGASVSYLRPPQEVQAAFDEVTRAQTAIGVREHDARRQAERELRQADAEADRIDKIALAYVHEQLALARAEADTFDKRLRQYQQLSKGNPDYLSGLWWQEIGKLFAKLKENGQIDLLDHHLNRDGLDLTTVLPSADKKK